MAEVSDRRNITVTASKTHIADVKALARLANMPYKEILSMCLASGVDRMMHQARQLAEGQRGDGGE